MSLTENKALARRIFDTFDAQGPGAIAPFFREDLKISTNGATPMDLPAFLQFGEMFYSAFPDFDHGIQDQFAEGDRVVTRGMMTGTHKGDFQGIPPTGRRVTAGWISIHRIVDGKVAEEWVQFDALGLLQQLGAIPAPAAATA